MPIGIGRINPGNGGSGALPGGAWVPWDALVSNNPGIGDYTSISAACAAEPAGAIIAVDSNPATPYTEVANIVPKAGQVIMAFDGERAGGTVTILMSDFNIQVGVNDVIITGIYFHWDNMLVGNFYALDVSGDDCRFEDLTLDLDNATLGLPILVRGIRLNGSSDCRLENITLRGNDLAVRPILLDSALDNDLIDLDIYNGWVDDEGGIRIVDSGGNNFRGIRFVLANFNLGTFMVEERWAGASPDPNNFLQCTITGPNQDGGVLFRNNYSTISDSEILECGNLNSIECGAIGNRVTNMRLTSGGGGNAILVTTNPVHADQPTLGDRCVISDVVCEGNFTDVYVQDSSANGNVITNVTETETPPAMGAEPGTGDFLCNVIIPGGTIDIAGAGGVDGVTLVNCEANTLNVAGVAMDNNREFGCRFTNVIDTSNALRRGVGMHVAVVAPTINDDINDGFITGVSRWWNSNTFIEYLCMSNAVGAANWVPVGATAGRAPWNVLVHPTAGFGDYTTPSAACLGEAEGTIIAIAPGTYNEVANILMKEGQVLWGLGGVEGDDFSSVIVNLTGSQILRLHDDVQVKGIYFTCDRNAPADDVRMVEFNSATRAVVENCTFDCTPTAGVQQHQVFGIDSITFCRVENVNIIGDTVTYTPFDGGTVGNVTDNIFKNIRISGCFTANNPGEEYLIDLDDPERNTWDTIYHDHRGLASVQAGAMISININGDREPCTYRNIFFANDASAADGTAIRMAGGTFRKADVLSDISLIGFYIGLSSNVGSFALDKFSMDAPGSIGLDINTADSIRITNGYIRAAGAKGLEIAATDSVIDNIVLDSTAGTYDLQILATSNDLKVSNIHGTKEIEINDGNNSLTNFECVLLDVNDVENTISNGEISDVDVDGADNFFSNLYIYGTLDIGAALGSDTSHFSNCRVVGITTIYAGASNHHFVGCELATLNLAGAFTAFNKFSGCYIGAGTIGTAGACDDTMFSACRITNYTVTNGNDTKFAGCTIDGTLTNGANAIRTTISGCRIATFGDSGQDTIRDVYTQETLAGAGPASIRGSREYDNTGLGVGTVITLPDPAVVQVSVGYRFRVVVTAAQLITIAQPALQQIHINGVSSTAGAGGNANSNTQWSVLELEYKGNNDWVAVAMLGTWNLV